MATGDFAGQVFHHRFGGEIVTYIAKTTRRLPADGGVVADDTARLLPAMLQGVQAKGDKIGRIRNAYHAKDAAFFLKLILVICVAQIGGVKRMCGGHDLGLARGHGLSSSESVKLHRLCKDIVRGCHPT